jgi:hypothetical protein
MRRVYRVLISERFAYHHDIEADSADDAKERVHASFDRQQGAEDIQPVEDHDGYTGYQVEDAIKIPYEDSDLA